MYSPSTLPVLIVGAGPSGLVAALSLLQHNVPVRIVDKRLKPSIGFKGSGLQPRSIELYRFLDVISEVWEKSSMFPISRMYNTSKGTHIDFHFAKVLEPTPGIPYPNFRRFDQGSHEGLLRSQLAKYGCSVEFDVALESLDQHEDHVVVHLAKGSDQKETASFAYVISADGGKGITRKLLGFPFLGDTHSDRGLFGDIRVEEGLDRNYWHMWQDPGKSFNMLGLCYTGNENIFGIVMFVKSSEGESNLPTDRDSVIKAFHSITGSTNVKFGELVNLQEWRPNIRMVEQFHKGRVFLAGDAAHIHSPTGGQGLNSSIQDSHNLAWKLSLCYHGLASDKLLETYTAERRPVISQMLNTTTAILKATYALGAGSTPEGNPKTPTSDSPVTDGSVSNVSENAKGPSPNASSDSKPSALERGGKLLMLGVNYRGSSILIDERNPHSQEAGESNDYYDSTKDGLICAGDRAPEAPALEVMNGLSKGEYAGQVSLFDLFRATRHTVLVFNANAEDIKALTTVLKSKYPQLPQKTCWIVPQDSASPPDSADVDLVLRDTKGYAHVSYAIPQNETRSTVIVVRPDGAIGGVVLSGSEGVDKYFAKLVGA